jgi:transporter family-2 protein
MDSALMTLSLLVGGLLTVQAAANVQLNSAIRNPAAAAALQLGVATVLLIGLAAVIGELGALSETFEAERWHLMGGLGSALYITAGIVLFPRLGALTSVGLFITGQMIGSLALDSLGLLGLDCQPLSAAAALGALAVVAGMGLIVATGERAADPTTAGSTGSGTGQPRARIRTPVAPLPTRRGGLVGLGLLAGAGLPIQAAINAKLRTDLDAPLAAAGFSFVIATATMLAILGLVTTIGRNPSPQYRGLVRIPWWGWLGGLVGASYVTVTLLAVPEIGAAPAIALTIAGQQLVSALADHRGLLRLPQRPVSRSRLLGVAVLLTGAVVGQLS